MAIPNKLTSRQIEEIVEMYRNGISQSEIAECYGVSQKTISNHTIRAGFRKYNHRETNSGAAITCKCGAELVLPYGVKALRYCYVCGRKFKTPAEQAMDKLGNLLSVSKYLPETVKAGYVDDIRFVLNFLEGGETNETD